MTGFLHHLAAALPALLQGGRAINGKDSAVFWWLLYVMVRLSGVHDAHHVFRLLLTNECQSTDDMLGTCALQPVAWLAMGVLAIFRLKIGEHSARGLLSHMAASLPCQQWSGAHCSFRDSLAALQITCL